MKSSSEGVVVLVLLNDDDIYIYIYIYIYIAYARDYYVIVMRTDVSDVSSDSL